MNRSTPLRRKSWMKRGSCAMKRTPINRRSGRAKIDSPERRTCLATVRSRCGGKCEARIHPACTNQMNHGHEVTPRGRGGDPTDPANVLGVCWICHDWITNHPTKAKEKGLTR
jgi:hypothetical protein